MFGSNGHIQQPNSVVANFLMRGNGDAGHIGNITLGKYIVRSSVIERLGVHSCILTDNSGILMTSDGSTDLQSDKQFVSSAEDKLSKYCLHCNHYAIQSWEWFKSVKMTRGDVNQSANENVRNDWYFKAYDLNQILDEELKNINSM
jgi:hypothetical protein